MLRCNNDIYVWLLLFVSSIYTLQELFDILRGCPYDIIKIRILIVVRTLSGTLYRELFSSIESVHLLEELLFSDHLSTVSLSSQILLTIITNLKRFNNTNTITNTHTNNDNNTTTKSNDNDNNNNIKNDQWEDEKNIQMLSDRLIINLCLVVKNITPKVIQTKVQLIPFYSV